MYCLVPVCHPSCVLKHSGGRGHRAPVVHCSDYAWVDSGYLGHAPGCLEHQGWHAHCLALVCCLVCLPECNGGWVWGVRAVCDPVWALVGPGGQEHVQVCFHAPACTFGPLHGGGHANRHA